jgi:hypothetical protein
MCKVVETYPNVFVGATDQEKGIRGVDDQKEFRAFDNERHDCTLSRDGSLKPVYSVDSPEWQTDVALSPASRECTAGLSRHSLPSKDVNRRFHIGADVGSLRGGIVSSQAIRMAFRIVSVSIRS